MVIKVFFPPLADTGEDYPTGPTPRHHHSYAADPMLPFGNCLPGTELLQSQLTIELSMGSLSWHRRQYLWHYRRSLWWLAVTNVAIGLLWNLSSRNRVTPVSIQYGVYHGITFAAISTIPAASSPISEELSPIPAALSQSLSQSVVANHCETR